MCKVLVTINAIFEYLNQIFSSPYCHPKTDVKQLDSFPKDQNFQSEKSNYYLQNNSVIFKKFILSGQNNLIS